MARKCTLGGFRAAAEKMQLDNARKEFGYFGDLTTEENTTILKARIAGYAEFFPCCDGKRTLAGAVAYLANN